MNVVRDKEGDVKLFAGGAVALSLFLCFLCCPAGAQNPAIDDLKAKISDARTAQLTFADGLKHCNELTGKSFYYRLRHRVLDLEAYLHSLEDLVKAQTFNPEKRRPWNLQDAEERREEVKKQAQEDKARCELVQSLPELEKSLQQLEKDSAASEKKE